MKKIIASVTIAGATLGLGTATARGHRLRRLRHHEDRERSG
jgi:hypothetical protein